MWICRREQIDLKHLHPLIIRDCAQTTRTHGELAHQTRSQLVVSHFIDVAITHENIEDLSAVLGVFGQDLE